MQPRFKIEIHIHETEGRQALRATFRDFEKDTAEVHTIVSGDIDPEVDGAAEYAARRLCYLLGERVALQLKS